MKHLCSLLTLSLTACGGPSTTVRPAPEVPPEIATRGDTIYFGTVYPLDGSSDQPTFVYERRVATEADGLRSTHITREPNGRVALAESALHDPDYALSDYTLHASQLGRTGSIHVEANRVSFRMSDGDRVRTATEETSDPVVVGPTLVGYIVRHLDGLEADQSLVVRMAILDRLETIGFQLTSVPSAPGQTKIRMKPTSFLIGLAVDPIDFTFDRQTQNLVRLEGRVPPKVRDGDGWADFDARVDYRFVADRYL